LVRRRRRARRSRAQRCFADAHRGHRPATCCMRVGSVRLAEGSDVRVSFLRRGTDAPAPGHIGRIRGLGGIKDLARQVHIDQGDALARLVLGGAAGRLGRVQPLDAWAASLTSGSVQGGPPSRGECS
jgi:hypothetical protein